MGCVAALLSFFQCEKGTVDSARSFARRCPKSSVSKEVNVAGVACSPGFEQVLGTTAIFSHFSEAERIIFSVLFCGSAGGWLSSSS